MKIKNYLCLIIFIFALLLAKDSFSYISTNLESVLPNSHKKELLKEFNQFKNNKKLFLSIKGFDEKDLINIQELEKKLLRIKGLSLAKNTSALKLKKHLEDYSFYKNTINKDALSPININKKLSTIKEQMLLDPFYFFTQERDPLNLYAVKIQKNVNLKNKHLILENYGYFSIFNLSSSLNTLEEYERVYDQIHSIIKKDTLIFSPIFYFVENSRIIKEDVNKILLFASVLLLSLYLFILKSPKLLFNTFLALSSSILLALFFTTELFGEISIFVLVFAVSISSVSIDYMFHHYMHDYYHQKKKFNKSVFFGFLTSIGAFLILSFVDFSLLKQICIFSALSLFFAYLHFTFLFPYITFKKRAKGFPFKQNAQKHYLRPSLITFFSLLIISVSLFNIEFDLNIKNLDVDNTSLDKKRDFFAKKLNTKEQSPILFEASSLNELTNIAYSLKQTYPQAYIPLSIVLSPQEFIEKKIFLKDNNLLSLKEQVKKEALFLGFKEDFFSKAYILRTEAPTFEQNDIKKMQLEVRYYKHTYYSYAYLPSPIKKELASNIVYHELSLKHLFIKDLKRVYTELSFLGVGSLVFILLMLVFTAKKRYFIAINYILFPLAMCLLFSSFFLFNILHLLMLFIILAIGIDFGIYMSSKQVSSSTKKAIVYSLLSTFCGFGVLVFSNITALYSLGTVASVGIVSILLLLLNSKKVFNDTEGL